MANFTVRVNFNDGTYNYDFPYVQAISDPQEGMKATVIEGIRGDGSVCIPGGKKSQTISVSGLLWDEDGYEDLTGLMDTLRASVTTDLATLTLKHWDPTITAGGDWVTDWTDAVRRISEISFPASKRTAIQPYNVNFLVLSY